MAGKNGCWNDFCISSNCKPDSVAHIDATGQSFRQGPRDDSPVMGDRLFSAAELREMPTLAIGQVDDLKFDDGQGVRFWLSRLGVEDGEPYSDKVSIEELIEGKWVTTAEYAG